MTTDVFGTLETVQRDHLDRPLIVPPDGGKPKPYTRVTTIAKTLDDSEALTKWKVRTALRGAALRPDLAMLIATTGDDRKDELNALAEQCLEAGSGSVKRNLGTALHSMTEAIDQGAPIESQPLEWQPLLVAYRNTLMAAGLRPVAAEVFIVNDEVPAAGTTDRLLAEEASGLVYPADIKTGRVNVQATQMQVAIYARGVLYDWRDATRYPLPINTERGILIHLPQDAPEPTCNLLELDLVQGWGDVLLALEVRKARRKRNGGGLWRPTASLPVVEPPALTLDDVEPTNDTGAESAPVPPEEASTAAGAVDAAPAPVSPETPAGAVMPSNDAPLVEVVPTTAPAEPEFVIVEDRHEGVIPIPESEAVERVCASCAKPFPTRKRSRAKTCSKECRGALKWSTRRGKAVQS